jgi:galactokinase
MPSVDHLREDVARRFAVRYGHAPTWIVAAPGRVNLIGEHTDYNDGFVLPMAIDRCTVVAAGRPVAHQAQPRIFWYCAAMRQIATIPATGPAAVGRPLWSNYVRGVIAGFQARGLECGPLDVLMKSDVPRGAGLSSSAALEVAVATLVEAVVGLDLDPLDKARLCQRAEHEFAGVPCGIMDQATAVLARPEHLLLLDCRSLEFEHVPMSDPAVSVLIVDTKAKRTLAKSAYAERRRECAEAAHGLGVEWLRDAGCEALDHGGHLERTLQRRARHVIGEIDRTQRAAIASKARDWAGLGRLVDASHASLRDDFEVSCAELDAVAEIARSIGPANGVYGCRMTGGGFGGCAVALVRSDDVAAVSRTIAAEYEARIGVAPGLLVSRPMGGAAVLVAP